MNIKSFYFFCIFTIFFSNVFSMNRFMSTRPREDLRLYQLPSENVMRCLEVSSELVPLIEEVDDFDEEYEKALKSLKTLKEQESNWDFGGACLVFDFKNEITLKKFLMELYVIAKGLRTSILHLLVELKFIKDLQACIDCMEKNKEDFYFNNIDPIPSLDKTYPVHKYKTPLFYAVYLNNYEKAKILIENGADIYAKNQFGYSLLHFAIYHNNIDLIKLIIDKFKEHLENKERVDFNVLNDQDNKTKHSPLHFAVWKGNIQVLKILLEQKLDLRLRDKARQTVFHILVKCYINNENYRMNAEKILKMLIKKVNKCVVPRWDSNRKLPQDYFQENNPLRRVLISSTCAGFYEYLGY